MIRIYDERGNCWRREGVDPNQVNRWQALVLGAMTKMAAAGMNAVLREQLARLREVSERILCSLPGKH
jgi:hypothetical protein